MDILLIDNHLVHGESIIRAFKKMDESYCLVHIAGLSCLQRYVSQKGLDTLHVVLISHDVRQMSKDLPAIVDLLQDFNGIIIGMSSGARVQLVFRHLGIEHFFLQSIWDFTSSELVEFVCKKVDHE